MVLFLCGSCSNEELQIENYQLKIANWKSVRDRHSRLQFSICNGQFSICNWHLVFSDPVLRTGAKRQRRLASAASTRSGVYGALGTRTPRALWTALAIAAAVEIVGGSPMPM